MITKWLAGVCVMLAMSVTARGKTPDNLVRAELLADTTAVSAGKPFVVGLHLTVADGWHVYWTNPGDAGAATTLKITAPAGWVVGPVEYPVPRKLPQPGGLTVYAYEKELLLTATVTPPANWNMAGSATISAVGAWCVCSDVCVLGKKAMELKMGGVGVSGGGAQRANAAVFDAWKGRMPVQAGEVFTSVGREVERSGGDTVVTLEFNWRNDPPVGTMQWLPGAVDDLVVTAGDVKTAGKVSRVTLIIKPVQGILANSSTIRGILAYYQQGQPAGGVEIALDRASWRSVAAK